MSKAAHSAIANPLATSDQLRSSASSLDGIPDILERTLRFRGCLLTQAAGILLQLNQDIVAQAVVIFSRFFVGPEGGSFRMHGIKDMSAASLFLAAKLSATPQTMRAILNAYAYLVSSVSPLDQADGVKLSASEVPSPALYTISEGEYQIQRQLLMDNEALILRHIGYATKVVLPHSLALTYVQTIASTANLGAGPKKRLAARTVALLNTALLSPQLLYLTHQPHMLAVAAVYLAARETGYKVGVDEWWLVWDVTREELGFLVVALQSTEAWIAAHAGRGLWTVHEVEAALTTSD